MTNIDLVSGEASSFSIEPEKELTGPRFLTSSQAAALRQLSNLVGLRGQPNRAGITLRNKPLLIGPSGSGKTAVIRRLCDTEELPLLVINAGSWIVYGAQTAAHTLSVIRRFVELNPRGCIFVDEIDKACPSGAETFGHSWSLGVLTEIVSFCDADGKLETCGWTAPMIKRLSQSYFVVSAGAWQAHAVSARKDSASTDGVTNGYARQVMANAGIPEELLFRFNARLLEISAPTRKDLSLAMQRIHSDLSLPALNPSDKNRLLEEALNSHCGMRWVEQYLSDLLIQFPQAREKVELVAEKSSDKLRIGRREYTHQLSKGVELMEGAQKMVRELEIKLRLTRRLALSAPVEQQKDLLDPKEILGFIDLLVKFGPCLRYGTSITMAQRRLRETELSVHGAELLGALDSWLRTKTFALKSCGLLDLAIQLEVSVQRIIACWKHLSGVDVVDEAS